GRALALRYAAPGVFLALSGRDEDRMEEISRLCREKGADVDVAVLDVNNRGAMEDWIAAIEEDGHQIDLVIANAGISGGTGGVMNGEPVGQARAIFETNVMGVLNTVEPVLPRMTARKAGQVVFISSMAGFRGFPSAPAYSASKGAVRFYGEALRGALADTGVKVNVVCPGFVKTRMTDANDFPMPFLMDAELAADIIVRGIAANKGRIAFPFPVHIMSWFLSILPDCAAQYILKKLPAKQTR
ncbi:MAG: short-chain dehydrogenase, partial [Micavibrio aeruginosavorus]